MDRNVCEILTESHVPIVVILMAHEAVVSNFSFQRFLPYWNANRETVALRSDPMQWHSLLS